MAAPSPVLLDVQMKETHSVEGNIFEWLSEGRCVTISAALNL